jgi:hypothetical protein
MAPVVAALRRGHGRGAAGGLGQEIDGARRAQHLYPELAEAAPGLQPKGCGIERNRLVEVVDINVE